MKNIKQKFPCIYKLLHEFHWLVHAITLKVIRVFKHLKTIFDDEVVKISIVRQLCSYTLDIHKTALSKTKSFKNFHCLSVFNSPIFSRVRTKWKVLFLYGKYRPEKIRILFSAVLFCKTFPCYPVLLYLRKFSKSILGLFLTIQ